MSGSQWLGQSKLFKLVGQGGFVKEGSKCTRG